MEQKSIKRFVGSRKEIILCAALFAFALGGCNGFSFKNGMGATSTFGIKSIANPEITYPASNTPEIIRTHPPTQTPVRLLSPKTQATSTALPDDRSEPVQSPTWSYFPVGSIQVPILLYHHIEDNPDNSRYTVSPKVFTRQMELLSDWGYTSIPLSILVRVIKKGGELPPHAMVISFDDGHESVYTSAYPILQEYGFIGVVFVVGSRLHADGFLEISQLKEMVAAGWEVGSHSMNHADLTASSTLLRVELLESRLRLENELSIPVVYFAYPYGKVSPHVVQKVQDYGYVSAVGLGQSWNHSASSIFYLSRLEIMGDMSIDEFTEWFH